MGCLFICFSFLFMFMLIQACSHTSLSILKCCAYLFLVCTTFYSNKSRLECQGLSKSLPVYFNNFGHFTTSKEFMALNRLESIPFSIYTLVSVVNYSILPEVESAQQIFFNGKVFWREKQRKTFVINISIHLNQRTLSTKYGKSTLYVTIINLN